MLRMNFGRKYVCMTVGLQEDDKEERSCYTVVESHDTL